jgi:hypothetical protein
LLILVVLVGGVLVQPSFAMPPVAAGRVLHSHAAEIDFILRSGSTENLIATIGVDGAGNIEATFPGAPIPLVGNVTVSVSPLASQAGRSQLVSATGLRLQSLSSDCR